MQTSTEKKQQQKYKLQFKHGGKMKPVLLLIMFYLLKKIGLRESLYVKKILQGGFKS